MEANTDNIQKKGKMCTLKELEEYLGNDKETEINVIHYNKIAYRENNIEEMPSELKNIEVKVVKYKKYSFIIGEECKIEKYSIDGNEYIEIGESGNKNEDDEMSAKNTKLYYKNDDCSEITGGWDFFVNNELQTSTLENNNYSCTYGEYNITTENLESSVIPISYNSTGSSIEFKTKNKIDLTSYDRIGVLATTENITDYQLIGITNNSEHNNIGYQSTNKVSIKSNEPTYFEISDFIGEYYIQLGMGSYLNGKSQIQEIWLERDKKEILNIYNRGNEYKNIGGELINNPVVPNSETTGKLTKNSDHMLFEITSVDSNPHCTKTELMNITGYDKLRVEFEPISYIDYKWRNISLSVLGQSGNVVKSEVKCGPYWGKGDSIGEKRLETFDISDLTDTQKEQTYFGISGNAYTFKIYRIWLEKIIKP